MDTLWNYLASGADVLGLTNGFSPFKPSDALFGLDKAYMQSVHRATYSFRAPDSKFREYLGVFDVHRKDVCTECETVVFFMHGGSFVTGDMYTIQTQLLAVAAALHAPLVSVEYPLNRYAGVTLELVQQSLDRSFAKTKALFPRARIVVSGASAGGSLALDVAQRHASDPRLAGMIVDSPNICLTTLIEQIARADVSCVAPNVSKVKRVDVGLVAYDELCFDDFVPSVPTMLLLPQLDFIIPPENSAPWAPVGAKRGARETIRFCRDDYAIHAYSLSLGGGCIEDVAQWARDANLTLKRDVLREELLPFEWKQRIGFMFQDLFVGTVLQPAICRFICNDGRDPFDSYIFNCNPSADLSDFEVE